MLRRRSLAALTAAASVTMALAVSDVQASTPEGGTVDATTTRVDWSGSTLVQTGGLQGGGCLQTPAGDPTCDTFRLTVGELTPASAKKPKRKAPPPANDVVVGLAPGSEGIAEFDLYVYDSNGAEVARSVDLGTNDTVTLRDVSPATYVVAVQNVLSQDPQATYRASAQVVDAGPEVPVDEESPCGLEGAPGRDLLLEADQPIGSAALVGDPTAVVDGADRSERIGLDVLVLLDGVSLADAQTIYDHTAGAPRSYEPLNIDLRAVEYRTVSFTGTDAAGLIAQAKSAVGGQRPAGVDIVEVLTSKDIQQLGQNAVAGLADCIGGVAHPDRAFLVAEAYTPSDYSVDPLPVVFGVDANPNVTAHEIGHLMGGHHHYGNCVESIGADDVDGGIEGSPCTLMFNAADFLGPNFSSLNATVVRGNAVRWAQP